MQAQQILFIEDDPMTGLSTCQFMRDRGIRVLDVDGPPAAIDVIARRGYLSALVTDIDLGGDQDGFDIARYARVVYPGLPVVFVSGTAASRHALEGVEGSVFIDKPYHPRQILQALEKLAAPKALCLGPLRRETPEYGDRASSILRVQPIESNEIKAL